VTSKDLHRALYSIPALHLDRAPWPLREGIWISTLHFDIQADLDTVNACMISGSEPDEPFTWMTLSSISGLNIAGLLGDSRWTTHRRSMLGMRVWPSRTA
jgi:hypothetical protein